MIAEQVGDILGFDAEWFSVLFLLRNELTQRASVEMPDSIYNMLPGSQLRNTIARLDANYPKLLVSSVRT